MSFRSVLFAVAALPLVPTEGAADEVCNELWFTRNALINQAGYCFGSPLGQALFDNSDCIGKSVQLSPKSEAAVIQIKALERKYSCKVNTAQRTLSLQDMVQRQQLWHFPIWDELESACIGWLSQVAPLRAGHSPEAPVIGQIEVGDTVRYGHLPQGDWSYAMVFDSNWTFKSAGWLDFNTADEACEQFAG